MVPNNKPSEQRTKKYILNASLVPFFGKMRLGKITTHDIERYKAHALKEGVTRKTINNRLTVLRKCMSTAYDWLELPGTPPKFVWLKCPPHAMDYLSPDECELLLAHADGVIREMILTALRTGMRQGELKGLQWSSIDWQNRSIGVCIFAACPTGYHNDGHDHCVADDAECTAPNYCQENDLIDGCTGSTIQTCEWGCTAGRCDGVPAPNATLRAIPSLVMRDNTTVVSWSSQYATACTVSGTNGDSWTGLNGSQTSSAIHSQATYTLSCNGHAGANPPSITKSVTVNIAPTFQER